MAVLKYYNTTTSAWEYIAASTTANFTSWKKTASGGETSVSGTDDNAVTLSYTVGLEQVFINGVLQVRGSDYTATTGTSITGLTALVASDIVTVVCYAPFNIANTIAPTLVDAKGDLIAGTAADTVGRLAVGTNDQVLTAASGEASGLKWATGTTELISSQAVSASSGIDFSSIPQGYKHLLIVWEGVYQSAISTWFDLRFNDDSGSNYKQSYQYQETGSAPSLTKETSTYAGAQTIGAQAQSTTAEETSKGFFWIYDYASTSVNKSYYMQNYWWSTNNSRNNWTSLIGYWASTSAINKVSFVRRNSTATMTNLANTSIRLYGVK